MRNWLSLALLFSCALGCHEAPPAQVEAKLDAPKPAPEAPAPAPAEPKQAQPEVKEEAFVLRASAPESAEGPFDFIVTLEALSGYKVNPEYPIKFTFDTGAFSAEPEVLRKEQGQFEEKKAELKGVVKLTAPGPNVVSGKLSFSVCTEERCLIEKRDLAVSVLGS